MKDASKALHIKPESTKAIIARGEALYSMGEFEQGLLQFQRGWRTRPHPSMKIGLQKCKDAIANAIGPNAKDLDEDLVKKVIEVQEKEKNGKRKDSEEVVQLLSKKKILKMKRKREAERRIVDRLLLGNIALEASFLRKLAEVDKEEESKDIEVSEYQMCVIRIAEDALNYLEKRKNFWQQIAVCQD